MTKHFLVFVLTAILLSASMPFFIFAETTSATSSDVTTQIQALMAEIAKLKAQQAGQGGGDSATMVQSAPVVVDQSQQAKQNQSCGGFNKVLSFKPNAPFNSEVVRLQDFLADQDYDIGDDANGVFGTGTLSALKQFQADNGISRTGSTGPKTRKLINRLACQPQMSSQLDQINQQYQPTQQQNYQQQNNQYQTNQQTQSQGSPQKNGVPPPPECVGKSATDANLLQSCKIWFGLVQEPPPVSTTQQYQPTQQQSYQYQPSYQSPSGQKEQIWNNNGLRSWIRSDADQARIDQLKSACVSVSSGINVWLPNAGNYSSPDFGMPDSAKCARAAACTTGQYFDGTNCVNTSTSNSSGGSYSSVGTGASCPSGQYWNGTACQVSNSTYCNSPANCTDPSVCRSSGWIWNDSNHTCTSSTAMQGGNCASGQYWNGTSCVNNTYNQPPSGGCGPNMYWNGTSCVSNNMPTPPSGGCSGPNQYWNGSACVTNPNVQAPSTGGSQPPAGGVPSSTSQPPPETANPPPTSMLPISQLPAGLLQGFSNLLNNLYLALSKLSNQ